MGEKGTGVEDADGANSVAVQVDVNRSSDSLSHEAPGETYLVVEE